MKMETSIDNLPSWKNASQVYSNAYKMLETMRDNKAKRIGNDVGYLMNVSVDHNMKNLIDALNEGNEEKIKGLILLYKSYGFDKGN